MCDLQINYKSYGNNKNSLMTNKAFFTFCNLKFFPLRQIRQGAIMDKTPTHALFTQHYISLAS